MFMTLLALSYPSIFQTHWAWIQTIRKQHDPQSSPVAHYFTRAKGYKARSRNTFCQ